MKKVLSIVLAISMIMSLVVCVPVSADALPGNIATDYAPDYDVSKYTGNFVNTPWTPEMNGNRWNVGGSGPEVDVGTSRGDGWYEFMATRDVGNPLANASGELNYQGTPLSGTNVSFTKPASGTNGNVVFSFDVTIDSDNPAYGDQRVQIARRLNGGDGENGQEYPVEYPGVDKGYRLTKDVFTKFQGTFKKVEGVDGANYGAYSVGLPMGSKSGARFEIRGENAYIGYEYAYDMEVVADVTASFPGGSLDVDANVLNQIGKDGDFDDSVTWYVTNADRTEAAEGFTVVEGENGKAKIYADTTVEKGTYAVVAVSDVYADFVKGIEIEIGENPYADYVPGEKTGNFVNADWTPGRNGKADSWMNRPDWPELGIADGNWYGFMANEALTVPGDKGDGTYDWQVAVLHGTNVGFTKPASGTKGNTVFSFDLTTDSGSYTTYVNIGRRNNTAGQDPSGYEFPKEYPTWNDGIKLTKGEVTKFTGTFEQVGNVSGDSYGAYSLGFRMGAGVGQRFIVNKATAYIGYEYIYDLDVEASAAEITVGEEVEVEATVLNQIGKAYSGETGAITWKAMDTARTTTIDGITIEDGVVTVDETVAPGMYDIVAVYGNAEMVKGVEIEVKANPYADYVPGEKTGNFVNADWTPGGNGKADSWMNRPDWPELGIADGNWYGFMANEALTVPGDNGDGTYNWQTAVLHGTNVGFTKPASGTKGNTVFSFDLTTDSGSYTTYVNIGRRNNTAGQDPSGYEFPKEYPTWNDGIKLTKGEVTKFTGTFEQVGNVSGNSYGAYSLGFRMGAGVGQRFIVNKSTAYIGYEYAYDLEVSAAAETVAQGETVAVEATVLNQIGKEYAGTKEVITWKAMNTARTAFVDGITVVDGVATVADTVAPGTYDIVAVYGDKLMAKGVSIEVTEAAPVIEGITISATENGITVATATALNDAQLIFVTYESGKMVAVNNATKVTLVAQGTQEYSIPSGFANAKVMLFTADYKPLANVLN